MNPRWRASFSTALVGLLGVVVAGASWLGVAQEPSSGAVLWGTFVADTTAAGSLAFITTSGSASTRDVTRGLVDFANQDETARTVVGNLRPRPEIELRVVNGIGYQRTALPGASGGWRRLSAPVGLAPFIGAALPLFSASPAALTRLGEIDLRGTATTEYRVASTTFTCPANRDGEPTHETSVVRAWVDGGGHIRQLQTVVFAQFGPDVTFRSDTTTVLRRIGTPVHVSAPARFTQPVSSVNLRLTPGSGCVVTQH